MNIEELRNDLIKVYENLRNGTIGIDEAKQSCNAAGKIISTGKSQMEYNKMTGNGKRPIPFYEIDGK